MRRAAAPDANCRLRPGGDSQRLGPRRIDNSLLRNSCSLPRTAQCRGSVSGQRYLDAGVAWAGLAGRVGSLEDAPTLHRAKGKAKRVFACADLAPKIFGLFDARPRGQRLAACRSRCACLRSAVAPCVPLRASGTSRPQCGPPRSVRTFAARIVKINDCVR